jgi:hypothetical protein
MTSAGNLAFQARDAGSGFQPAFDCFVRARRLRLDQRAHDSFELDESPVMTKADPSCRMPGNSAKMPRRRRTKAIER